MASTFSFLGDYASSSLVAKRYDVFISFRGEDTRGDFTSHLHAALRRNNIDTYIDYRIQKGEQVWVELLKAIKDSTLFLVIFSEKYAYSSWCLNELVELMECKKQEQDHVHVIPIFYKVDPSQVRKQEGSYHVAFEEHKKDGKVSEEKMQQWKNALYKAANLSGFHSKAYRTENDLIEGIIKAISEKLNHNKYTNTFTSHFIYDENYTKIESLLKINSKKVQVIGIWGMGGIGKTSLATAIFRNVSSQYEGTCFLANVAEESKRHGLNYLCKKLLSDLLGEDLHIDNTNVIPYFVARRLMRKKVLIVLDDVNTSRLLVKLVGENRDVLRAGSRIIVTTRDKQVLISGNVEKIHEVKLMNSQNSLKFFSLKAFHKTYPEKGYEELSNRATNYAKGIPLALEVLGSFLHSKREKNEWDSALLKLEKIPNGEIQEVLKLSFDGLDPCEKKIFLDIACFFNGEERDHVTKIFNACNFFADIGIARLLEKALITTNSCKNRIEMHKLIQEMGRDIVRQESPENPGQRSRLWDHEDVYDVLTNNRGTDAVEVIWLGMTQIAHINAFRKMPNLRLVVFRGESGRIHSLYLPKALRFLPKKLRYFGWDRYSLESFPSTFCPENLVELCMRRSNVRRLWQGVQNLPKLEKFDLFGSQYLVEFPNLSGAPKLKFLCMSGCESLSSIHPSIFSLRKLEHLELAQFTSLENLRYGNLYMYSLIMFGVNLDSIWHQRNEGVFKQSNPDTVTILMRILKLMKQLEDHNTLTNDCQLVLKTKLPKDQGLIHRHMWNLPPQGHFKLNCNGAVNAELTTACGGIIRDWSGNLVVAFARNLGSCSVMEAECWAVYCGIQIAWARGLQSLIVESDSLYVIELLVSKNILNHVCNPVIKKIEEFCDQGGEFKWVHIFREANLVADRLAKFGLSISGDQGRIFDIIFPFFNVEFMKDVNDVRLCRMINEIRIGGV